MVEIKAFLLYEKGEWNEKGGYSMRPACVVLATMIRKAAEKVGGRVEERGTWDDKEEVIVFPRGNLDTPIC